MSARGATSASPRPAPGFRARVEPGFGAIEPMGGELPRTIGQARPNFALTVMAACFNRKRLVYFQKAGIVAIRRQKWAESPMSEAILGKKWAIPPKNAVICRRT